MSKFYQLYNRYFIFIMAGLLVFIPLFPKLPLFNVPGTYVAIRSEDFFIALTVMIWLVFNFKRLKQIFKQPIFQAILVFWLVGLLSVISGIFITHSVSPHLALLHWARRVEYMSLFLMAATSIQSTIQVKSLIKAMLVTAIFVVLYGFGQIVFKLPVISTTNSEFSKGVLLHLTEGSRVNSTFAGHYDLALYLTIILVFLASFFFYYRNFILKSLMVGFSGLSFLLLGLTAARVSFVTTILGICSILWLTKNRILLILFVVAAISTVAVIPELRHRLVATVTVNILGGGGPKYNPPPDTVTIFTPEKNLTPEQKIQLQEKSQREATMGADIQSSQPVDVVPGEPINTTELGVYRSYGIRLDVEWPRAWNAFFKNPLLGTGYSSIGLATDNDYLRSLGETGLLGTLVLGLIFYGLIKRMVNFYKNNGRFENFFTIATLCSVVALLLTALFIDVLESSKVAEIMWFLLGIQWALMQRFRLATPKTDD